MGIPDHLIFLLRNLYAGQEATVRTGHGTTDWFQIGKGVHQGCILSPWLFNLYAEYIMRNAGLEEAQAGIKIAGRNINNLRYADNTTLMAESEEELKSLSMKVKVIIIWFLFFNLLMWCITLIDLRILKNPCIPGIKPTWSWCMIFLMCCWILIARILLRIFASMFISDIGL